MTYHFHDITACNMCGNKSFTVVGKRLNKPLGKNPRRLQGISVSIVRCDNCKLIFANPQPVPAHISDHYGTPPENYWTPEYFKINPEYFSYELKKLNTIMSVQKGMKALDIGAGIGKCMIALQNAGMEVWGFEPSEPFYKRAIEKMKIPVERLQLCTVEDARYEKNFFDFITFGAVLEHIFTPGDSIKQAMQWLKPGGTMQIEIPSARWLVHKLAGCYYRLICTDYTTHISPMHNPYHLYEFTLESFQKHAALNNYEIALREYYVGATYVPAPLSPLLKFIMKKTNTGMQLCVWLRKK